MHAPTSVDSVGQPLWPAVSPQRVQSEYSYSEYRT
jgi:hypothetical protein